MITIIDNKNRGVLSEGRSFQMGFAFLLRKDINTFETVQPISPCKDYLNDVVWSEVNNKYITAYGCTYDKLGLFEKEKKAFLAIKIMPTKTGDYPDLKKDRERLKNNYKNLQKFLNFFNTQINVSKYKVIISETDKEDMYHIAFPKEWCQYTYSISLFSLLCRVGQFWNGETPIMDYLADFHDFNNDMFLVQGMLPKLKKIIALKKLPEQDVTALSGGTTAHNFGIAAFNI